MNLNFSDKLTIADFEKFPVWEFDTSREAVGKEGETVVRPVLDLPVTSLANRFVGVPVMLANGSKVFAALIGINLERVVPLGAMVVYHQNDMFVFRRSAPSLSGPEQLAHFLGLDVRDVFPIRYDISRYVTGPSALIVGEIPLTVPPDSSGTSRKDRYKQILEEMRRKGGTEE